LPNARFFNGPTDQQAFILDHAHRLAFFQGGERRRLDGDGKATMKAVSTMSSAAYGVVIVGSEDRASDLIVLESLMSRYQQADEEAARALIEKVSPLLLRYFWAHASHRRFADDLLQDTWMRVHKARHAYRRGEPVLPWIFAIARHVRLDNYRRARRVEIFETQVDVLPEIAASSSNVLPGVPDIDAILAELPASQREVIVMLKVSGMTIEEIARTTSSSAGSVKQKAHRAYRKLRDLLTSGVKRQ
jgi:RNA polymerase sigma-70 factor (ECF subfamily)